MKRLLPIIAAILLLTCPPGAQAGVIALCYHDVRDNLHETGDADSFTVSTDRLISHFEWLRANDYQPVSINDLLAERRGEKKLPEKAVLLTFDDGYTSFYTHIFPLLKSYGYPAVFALVGSWLETPADGLVAYGNQQLPRSRFLSWEQIREMQASGLIEFASHSYNLHRGILANPQGNEMPAGATRAYDAEGKTYENDDAFRERIFADLQKNKELLLREIGVAPRVMVWPYGAYNLSGIEVANNLGMPVTFSLDDGDNEPFDLEQFQRIVISQDFDLYQLTTKVRNPEPFQPVRVAHVDLDYVYDPDPEQQNRNLDLLLERIRALQINTVFLQAYADPDGDGNASALYFPNRHLPMRADLFSRVAWQLRTRCQVRVYAWLPVLAFDLGDAFYQKNGIQEEKDGLVLPSSNAYRRLSFFKPEVRTLIAEIYEDLGKHAYFSGVLFHDDALLTDFEDASPEALAYYARHGITEKSLAALRSNPETLAAWSRLKTEALIDFTDELRNAAQRYRPQVKTARNTYARVVLQPESEQWFAQNFPLFLARYDYVALMAMPQMENAPEPEIWLKELVEKSSATPGALKKTIFELQSVDWRSAEKISSDELVAHMQFIARQQSLNFGYYPDDFLNNHPDLTTIRKGISLQTYPYKLP